MVVDASVTVSRLVAEEMSEPARALFRYCVDQRRIFAVPPHFPLEVTNALYQKQRVTDPRYHLDPSEVDAAVYEFGVHLQARIILVPHPALYPNAIDLARRFGLRTPYDTAYMALAELLGMELWTNDHRLLNAIGPDAPWVRWIGDFPLN